MSFFNNGSYRSGAGLVNPHAPSMEISMHTPIVYSALKPWEEHFNKCMLKHGDLGRPIMFIGNNKKVPCYNGNLKPSLDTYDINTEIEDIVFSPKDKKYYLVFVHDLVEPTQQEYDRYFKKDAELGRYKILTSIRSTKRYLYYIKNFKLVG